MTVQRQAGDEQVKSMHNATTAVSHLLWQSDGRGAWVTFLRWGRVVLVTGLGEGRVETAQQVVEKNRDACQRPPERGAI